MNLRRTRRRWNGIRKRSTRFEFLKIPALMGMLSPGPRGETGMMGLEGDEGYPGERGDDAPRGDIGERGIQG